MEIDSEMKKKEKRPKQPKVDDFGGMKGVLDSMESKLKHEQRLKQHEQKKLNQQNALDQEKQRLLQIANLNVFQEQSALDQLYMHINNQVSRK